MPWVRFTDRFRFKPKPEITLAYEADDECNVTRACAKAAFEDGKALRLRKVSKAAKPVEVGDGPRPAE